MTILSRELRSILGNTVRDARRIAEAGAKNAIEQLAVHHHEPWTSMTPEQRTLRNRLRAHGRQLGDRRDATRGGQTIDQLTAECAYEHWHRMLFARFLAESNLLIEPESGMDITLEICQDLAREQGKDWLELASAFAQRMLPEIFRIDDPVLAVMLPPEKRQELANILEALPQEVFMATDSLGWVYQFWQADKKDAVNASGNKIGADELPSVTQLFTEDYMVDFLLDNTLGAWHAGKVITANPKLAESAKSEDDLRAAIALPGCPWNYLRFIQGQDGKWIPTAGTFDGWPKTAKELKCLDPCMGSGHFVVAMFERLVALRMAEESLDEAAAVTEVIRDNLFGLEIDPRCTQIGAFNLALAAWRRVGHRPLPAMNLACSGLAPNAKREDWLELAGDNDRLQRGMARIYALFNDAPVLGSLINPRASGGDLLEADFHELQPLLEKALAQETKDDTAHEMAVTARGLGKAAEILAGMFTLVATNVPYLARGKYSEILKDHIERDFGSGKENLATAFVLRCNELCAAGGTSALVSLQTWLFLTSYKQLRIDLLRGVTWKIVAGLGTQAFSTPMWDFHVMLIALTRTEPAAGALIAGFDVSSAGAPDDKASFLRTVELESADQLEQLDNPDAGVGFGNETGAKLLSQHASFANGIQTSDRPRFVVCFWETPEMRPGWRLLQSTVQNTTLIGGLSSQMRWDEASQSIPDAFGSVVRGTAAWGKVGVCVSAMGDLPVAMYSGQLYDENCVVLTPKSPKDISPMWSYCSSEDFETNVRKICKALKVRRHLIAIPFDLAQWQKLAAVKYPLGLPKPFSSDPTQWLFNGYPKGSDQPLHVAVARLLGYQWPRQTGSSFHDCPALGPDGLEKHADADGIVCLKPLRGDPPAADRLISLLGDAFGSDWSSARLAGLLTEVDFAGKTLDDWLRDGFFVQHCQLFHQRPFIWHVWDGRADGFHALVNYHTLAGQKGKRTLEALIYTYLGDWIDHQRGDQKTGVEGADGRLAAAEQLKGELEKILAGEPPYDLFVRWKPLSEQPIGWEPDINDGVRMNIRPFMTAKPLAARGKGACILRTTPKIKWDKDRGKEPQRAKEDFPWFWKWDEATEDFSGTKTFDGNRWNDLHYTREFKEAARERGKK